MVVTTIFLLSCTHRQSETSMGDIFDEANLPPAEKLIQVAREAYNFDRVRVLADSLEKTGDISAVTANFYRGVVAFNRGLLKVSEFCKMKTSAILRRSWFAPNWWIISEVVFHILFLRIFAAAN